MKQEIYVSVDIETDGPIPGQNSMLSLGAVALSGNDFKRIGTFSVNLDQLPNAVMDERTKVEFWDKNPEAWKACREDTQDPKIAMQEFSNWLKNLEKEYNGRVVFVAYPAGFDFLFTYWYLIKFTGSSPFSFSALDMKTMAMTILKKKFRNTTKRKMPKRWFKKANDKGLKHSHVALEDAAEQGEIFAAMMQELRKDV